MHVDGQVTCPKCGQADTVRKVSALVTDGTWNSESAGLGLGIGKDSPELVALVGTSTSRSDLATKLAPPRKPAQPHGYGWAAVYGLGRLALVAFVGVLLIAVIVISFPLFFNTYSHHPLLILIPIAVIGAFVVSSIWWLAGSSVNDVRVRKVERDSYDGKLQAWKRMTSQWNELYYCARDDGVFTLKQRVLVPLSAYQSKRRARI